MMVWGYDGLRSRWFDNIPPKSSVVFSTTFLITFWGFSIDILNRVCYNAKVFGHPTTLMTGGGRAY
jgi:hypothetical protein